MRQVILIWGPRYPADSWTNDLEDYLRLLGWEVHRTPRFKDDDARERWETLELAQGTKADVFLTNHAAWIGGPPVATLNAYRNAGLLTVAISHDEPYRWNGYDNRAALQAPGYDLWFTNWDEPAHLLCHTAGRVVYSPCAARAAFRTSMIREQEYPIGFVGVYYPPRDPYLRAVADLGLRAWMVPRTEAPFHRWPPPADIAACLADNLTYMEVDDLAKICRRSILSLDIAEQPDGRVRSPKNRLFECLCAGSLTLAGRCRQTEELFEDGQHLVLYDDAQDLRQKAMYYLLRSDERERIAAQGSRYGLSRHTWFHRALQFSREIEEDLERREGFRLDGVGVVIATHDDPERLSQAVGSVWGVPLVIVETGQGPMITGNQAWLRAPGASKSRAFNLGVLALPKSCEWVQFLDGEDLLRVGWKQALANRVSGGIGGIVGIGVTTHQPENGYTRQVPPDMGTLCVSRTAFDVVGGFKGELRANDGWELVQRLESFGYSVPRVFHVLHSNRVHGT